MTGVQTCALPISMFFCLGSEGSNGSLFRNGWFQWFSLKKVKVPVVPYLDIGGSNVFLYRSCGFQRFPIQKWVVPMIFSLESEGSSGSLFRNGWSQWFLV